MKKQSKHTKTHKITVAMLAIVLTAATLLAACAPAQQNGGEATDQPGGNGTAQPADNTGEPAAPTNEPKDEIDMKNYPLFVDPDKAEYAFGEKGKGKVWNNDPVYQPYWLGNIIYQETVMCIDDGKEISGLLQYAPVKILSVRNDTYTKEYVEGTDYTVSGNKIILPPGTSCPYLTEDNLHGKNMPKPYRAVSSLTAVANTDTDYYMWTDSIFFTEGSLIHGHQISVSYVYDIKDVDTSVFAQYGSAAPKFLAKLKAGENVVISITGDSVTAGCSASSFFGRQPMMPQFPTLLNYALTKEYDVKVSVRNYAVGGTTSNEAVSTKVADKLIKAKSDLVLIHFGINDSGGLTASQLKANIKKVVDATRESLPECEFLFIKCFPANPVLYSDSKFKSYWKAVDELAAEYDCFYSLDLYTPGQEMLKTKKYLDVTGNGINHPNDFIVRFYAMNLVNLFVDYKK